MNVRKLIYICFVLTLILSVAVAGLNIEEFHPTLTKEVLIKLFYPAEPDPLKIIEQCKDKEKLESFAIEKIKSGFGDTNFFCENLRKEAKECRALYVEGCLASLIPGGLPCPISQQWLDDYFKRCLEGETSYVEIAIKNSQQECNEGWELYGKKNYAECINNIRATCNEKKYINDCLTRYGVKPEDFQDKYYCYGEDEISTAEFLCGENYAGQLQTEKTDDGCVFELNCNANPDPNKQCPESNERVCVDGLTFQDSCYVPESTPFLKGECSLFTKQEKSRTTIEGRTLKSYQDFADQCKREWKTSSLGIDCGQMFCIDQNAYIKDCLSKQGPRAAEGPEQICKNRVQEFLQVHEERCKASEGERQNCYKMQPEECTRPARAAEKCHDITFNQIKKMALEQLQKLCLLSPLSEKAKLIRVSSENIQSNETLEVAIELKDASEDAKRDVNKSIRIVSSSKDGAVYLGIAKKDDFERLKNKDYITDIKILAIGSDEESNVGEMIVAKLLALKEQQDDYDYEKTQLSSLLGIQSLHLIEAFKEADIIKTVEKSRGFFYGILRFLGLTKKREFKEIERLDASIKQIEEIKINLRELQWPDHTINGLIINEQIKVLEANKEEIKLLLDEKKRKVAE